MNLEFVDAFINWYVNGVCPVCDRKGNINDIYNNKTPHHKFIFPKSNDEIRQALLDKNSSLEEILSWTILKPKLRSFGFIKSW